MASKDGKSGGAGRGRGRGAPLGANKPRRPRDELIEKGIEIGTPRDERLQTNDINANKDSISKLDINNDLENMKISASNEQSMNEESPWQKDDTRSNENGANHTPSLQEIFIKALDKPEFVPRALQKPEQKYNEDTTPYGGYSETYVDPTADYNHGQSYNDSKSWDDYTPVFQTGSNQICISTEFLEFGNGHNTDQQTLDIFQNLVDEIALSPFDDDLYDFTAGLLREWIQQKETFTKMATMIFDRAVGDPSFRYPAGKLAQVLSEVRPEETLCRGKFQSEFFSVARVMYDKAVTLAKSTKDPKEMEFITGLAIFFGELLNSMKILGQVNKILKQKVLELVNIFLEHPIEKFIQCLTKFLKLVGPVLDATKETTKDNAVDAMFNKVREFWAGNQSNHLPSHLKEELFKVYKLHTRDWDRCVTPPASSNKNFDFTPQDMKVPVGPEDLGPYANEETLAEFMEAGRSEMYGSEDDMDEIEAAYEEFLIQSGQV